MVDGDEPAKPRRTRRSKTGSFAANDVAIGLSLVTAVPSELRGPWWFKTPEQCAGVAIPLAEMLGKLPAKTAKQFQSLILPITLLMALRALFADSIEVEKQLFAMHKQERQDEQNSGTGNESVFARETTSGNGPARDDSRVHSANGSSNGLILTGNTTATISDVTRLFAER